MTGLQMNVNHSQDNWMQAVAQKPQDDQIQTDPKKQKDDQVEASSEDPKAISSREYEECETCKKRKYKDGSDEMDVSFKSAAHVSPEAAGAAVRAHENQHVKNAYEKAEKDNGEVLSASVTIRTGRCPECGRTYVAGGTTKTMIKYTDETNPYQQNQKVLDSAEFSGANINSVL